MSVEQQENIGFGTILNALLERASASNLTPLCFKLPEIVIMLCDLKVTHESSYRAANSDVAVPIDISSGNKIILVCDKGVLEYTVSVTFAE